MYILVEDTIQVISDCIKTTYNILVSLKRSRRHGVWVFFVHVSLKLLTWEM